MLTLTNYDSSNGDAYQILFDGVDEFKIYNNSNVDVTASLTDDGTVKLNKGFFDKLYGSEFADIAMRNFELPYWDNNFKLKF